MSEQIRPKLTSESTGFDFWTGVYDTDHAAIKIKLTFERITDGDNGSIWCEARAVVQVDDKPSSIIPPSRTNLMNASKSGTGWKGLVATLSDMASDIRWDDAVSLGVSKTIEHYRNGEREQVLATTIDDPQHPYLLEPFIASSGVSVFYGEGGTGKSIIALAMAVSIASGVPLFGVKPYREGPVIYFDYEDDPLVHEERLSAVLSAANIKLLHPIYHRSLVAKVSQSQSSMRRSISDRGAVLAVLDSIGMGRGGSAINAEDTIRLFRALRSLGVPTLAIDHVNKEDKKEREISTPYGSIFTVNSARLLWGAVVAGSSSSLEKHIRLVNTKSNRTPIHKPMGLGISYTNEITNGVSQLISVKFTPYDAFWQAAETPPWDKIAMYLSSTDDERTITEIAHATVLERIVVNKEILRHKDQLVSTLRGNKEQTHSLVDDVQKTYELFAEIRG